MENILDSREVVAKCDATDLVKDIRQAIVGIFPKSCVSVRFTTNLCPSINVTFAYTQKSGWSNGIIQNDRAFHQFYIAYGIAQDGSILDKVKVELSVGGKVCGPNCTDSVKVGWRNKTGTTEQVVKHFVKYFTKLKIAIEEHPSY